MRRGGGLHLHLGASVGGHWLDGACCGSWDRGVALCPTHQCSENLVALHLLCQVGIRLGDLGLLDFMRQVSEHGNGAEAQLQDMVRQGASFFRVRKGPGTELAAALLG